MRSSRKIGLVIGFVAIAIVIGLIASNYFQAAGEYRALQDRQQTAQARLPGLVTEKADLESQEAQAKSVLNASKVKFPDRIESIEYDEDLCRLATESKVQIVRLTASPPAKRQVGTITYSVSSFVVVVKGETKDLLEFVNALRSGRDFQLPWSAQVNRVDIEYGAGQATINLDIYGYEG